MEGRYNMRSPAVKRLMKEAQELHEPTEQYFAQPLDDNLFEWHFTIRGPSDSEFESGIYHGRIILPPEYPMKPPSIMLLTPNGRFEIFKKICLSISGHHPESWQPSWSIRTALLAIIGFMPTHGGGAIGSLDYTAEERKVLAKKSQDWKCSSCGNVNNVLKPVTEASEKTKQEAKELAAQINFQGEKEKKEDTSAASANESGASAAATNENTASPGAASSTTPPVPPAFPWPMPPGMPGFPPNPGQSGQMPFQRFPFPPPPLMMAQAWQQQNSATTTQAPQFPPYFMHPMFSMFPRPPSAAGQPGQMPQMPPWFPRPSYTGGQTTTTSSAAKPVMSSQPAASTPTEPKKTPATQSPSTTSTSTQSAPGQTSSLSSQSTTNNPISSQSASTNEASQSPSVSQPAVSQASPSAASGVRQRRAARHKASPVTTPHPAPVLDQRPERQTTGGIVFSSLILLLGVAILLLLLRRLYVMDVLKW